MEVFLFSFTLDLARGLWFDQTSNEEMPTIGRSFQLLGIRLPDLKFLKLKFI